MYTMLKPYKEEKPLTTINKIRSILNELGIFVAEKHIQDGDYFTCRIEVANSDLIEFAIGTNGKGTYYSSSSSQHSNCGLGRNSTIH